MSNKDSVNISKYNIILPETDDRTLCLRVEKPISKEGYAENFLPKLQAMRDRTGEIRLLVDFARHQGWEVEAALMDMGALAEFGGCVRKLALVNPTKKEIAQYKFKDVLIKGEVRIFESSEFEQAVTWVKE